MKVTFVLAIVVLLVYTVHAERRPTDDPTTTTVKPKTTRSQATRCDDHAKFAVKQMFGKDEPIRTVSACRPNDRAKTYEISFSLAKKQCSHVMVRVDDNKAPVSVASQGRCADISA